MLATLKGGAKAAAIAPAHSATGTGNVVKTGSVLSMSASLGSKEVPFGKTAGQKKSTKKKKKKVKNYDDEGVGVGLP